MKAVEISEYGNATVLKVHEYPDFSDDAHAIQSTLNAEKVLVDVHWAGVNFVDIYQREGRYPGTELPLRLGIEGSGVVRIAADNSGFKAGQRVAFTTGVQGTYASQIWVPEANVVLVPDAISLKVACAAIEHGLTADMLVNDVAHLSAGQTVLVHAAAGGVGGILVQLLKQKDVRVIGTVSSASKAAWLTSIGVEAVRYDGAHDWLDAVKKMTKQRGVDVVFDSVGQATFQSSLDILALRSHLILFGAASGIVEPVSPSALMKKSATLTRPVLPHYIGDQDALRARASRLFKSIDQASLQIRLDSIFELENVSEAHELLESRRSSGKILLRVNGVD